ncbi:SDR family NAD(P)-dependent oxidoreductase [Trueperella sp. LYQ141]|uniref:SDR family NAD(P)-dependent oxidoreductase n=1 Tax=Trueperella sp. LYQ141 TaxID=3391058 RepID=UPI0039833CA9
MIDLSGKTVLVTGADGGLGQGIVRQFALAGANIAVHAIGPSERAEQMVARLRDSGKQAMNVTGDIRSEAEMAAVAAAVADRFGRIDVLVNNAGIQPLCAMEEMDKATWEQTVDVDLTGTFVVTQAVSPLMRADGKGGQITHIASIEASLPAKNHSHYDAAKAGVKMYARSGALELGKYGIRVNSVSPGLVDRGDLAEQWPQGYGSWMAAVPLERTAFPDDIGQACVFLASDLASFISGHDLVVDGGMSAVAAW